MKIVCQNVKVGLELVVTSSLNVQQVGLDLDELAPEKMSL